MKIFVFLCSFTSAFALNSLSRDLRCTAHFFEAHFALPENFDKTKDSWFMTEKMHEIFRKAPLSSYPYFKKIETLEWHLKMLEPKSFAFPYLTRYEITYLEARTTSQGQTLYRFEHKIAHRKSVEFTLDALEPHGLYLQNRVTHDQFLHLTCSPH